MVIGACVVQRTASASSATWRIRWLAFSTSSSPAASWSLQLDVGGNHYCGELQDRRGLQRGVGNGSYRTKIVPVELQVHGVTSSGLVLNTISRPRSSPVNRLTPSIAKPFRHDFALASTDFSAPWSTVRRLIGFRDAASSTGESIPWTGTTSKAAPPEIPRPSGVRCASRAYERQRKRRGLCWSHFRLDHSVRAFDRLVRLASPGSVSVVRRSLRHGTRFPPWNIRTLLFPPLHRLAGGLSSALVRTLLMGVLQD